MSRIDEMGHVPVVGMFTAGLAQIHPGAGRSQQNGHALLPGAHHRDVARRVAEAVLLLKGAVMFLVQNDQAQGWRRCEDRRAGAEQDGGLAPLHGQPGAPSLVVRQPGMRDDQRRREAGAKPRFQPTRVRAVTV